MPPAPSTAIVVIGVAGSGKTTVARALAEHFGHVFLDADDFHSAEARLQMAAGTPLVDAQRTPWVEALARELRRHALAGRSTVLAFSGLRAAHRRQLREAGVPLRFVYLHAPPSVIAQRLDARRDHFMPPALLPSQLGDLEDPGAEPDVVVVDAAGAPGEVMRRVLAALDRP